METTAFFCVSNGTTRLLPDSEAATRRNARKLMLVCAICVVFMGCEVAGGLYAGSLAVLSDAAHLFSDIAGFLISLLALKLTSRRATETHSFGFHRAEVIGALLSIALIWAVTAYLLIEATQRLLHPEPVDGLTMMIVAVLGLLVNIIMALVLHHDHDHDDHGHGHGHIHGLSHGHSHEDALEIEAGRRRVVVAQGASSPAGLQGSQSCSPLELSPGSEEAPFRHNEALLMTAGESDSLPKAPANLNVRSATIHVLGDLIQSVGVLLAAICIYFRPDWQFVDPLCTYAFSLIVLATTVRLLSEAIHVLMEGTPLSINPSLVLADLMRIPGVLAVHDLHIWSISPSNLTMTAHIVVRLEGDPDDVPEKSSLSTTIEPNSVYHHSHGAIYRRILVACQNVICQKYHIHHSTIQLESPKDWNAHCSPRICAL